jgi:hypothetical protein
MRLWDAGHFYVAGAVGATSESIVEVLALPGWPIWAHGATRDPYPGEFLAVVARIAGIASGP